jgi:hypothetical protein
MLRPMSQFREKGGLAKEEVELLFPIKHSEVAEECSICLMQI